MKILYIITLSEFGGAQSQLSAHIAGFAEKAEIELICSSHGPLTEAASRYGAHVHLIPTLGRAINPLDDVRTVNQLARYMVESRPTLVHVHSSKAGLLGRLAARMTGHPVIYTAHGWGFKPGVPATRRWLVWGSEFLAGRLCNQIICVSQYDHDLAERFHIAHSKRLTTIHNGVPDTPLRSRPAQIPVKIVMTARFQEPKDQSTLIHAFSVVDKRTPAELVFVGSGPFLPQCQQLAREVGAAERIHFLGDRNDVDKVLEEAQIFVLLSRYEGLPISILEAMRAGLPVIATHVGGVPELIESGQTGFLVPSSDAQSVTECLSTLIANPELRAAMGNRGRQKYLDQFTLAMMIEKTAAVYQRVLADA
jgi:glycosyltransferase involved in cell wall biosynthesis